MICTVHRTVFDQRCSKMFFITFEHKKFGTCFEDIFKTRCGLKTINILEKRWNKPEIHTNESFKNLLFCCHYSLLPNSVNKMGKTSIADSLDGRAGDWGSKGPQFKPRKGPSLRIVINTNLQLM